MKSLDVLAEEARAILADDEHVIWHALKLHKENLTEDMLAQPSAAALPHFYHDIRGLSAPKEALQALSNQRKQLETKIV